MDGDVIDLLETSLVVMFLISNLEENCDGKTSCEGQIKHDDNDM